MSYHHHRRSIASESLEFHQHGFPRILIILAELVALITSVLLTSSCTYAFESRKEDSKSVTFGGSTYMIPQSYLPSITSYDVRRRYAAFSFGLTLPSYTPAELDLSEFGRVGWHSQLKILVEYGLMFRDRQKLLEQTLAWGHMSPEKYIIARNGCRLYRGNFTVSSEVYACDHLTVTCTTINEVPSPVCSVFENIGDSTTVIYHYPRFFVNQAVEIDMRVNAIIREFKAR